MGGAVETAQINRNLFVEDDKNAGPIFWRIEIPRRLWALPVNHCIRKSA